MSAILLNDDNLYKNIIYIHVNVMRGTLLAAYWVTNNGPGSVFVLRNLAVNRVLTCVRESINY